MEIQFWGYESGNVLATIAGAGGFSVFGNTILHTFADSSLNAESKISYLASKHPDTTVTLGLCVLLICAPLIRNPAKNLAGAGLLNIVDTLLTLLAIAILWYALSNDASWVSLSGAAFVVASSFLRYSKKNPLLLKIGGLFLAAGGVCLGIFGSTNLAPALALNSTVEVTMAFLIITTGFYVTSASLLTYEGGIFQTDKYSNREEPHLKKNWVKNLLNPKHSFLSHCLQRMLDKPILVLNYQIIKPAIFWVRPNVKEHRPFKTSMLARLPWRLVTALVALFSISTYSWAFAAANAGWAIGDMAIGSEDW